MKYSRIIGTGSYLPEKILTNDELSKNLDTNNDWIVERTGIHQRRIAAKEDTPSTMAVAAAQNAIEAAQFDKTKIDLIIVATSTPDKYFPSAACLVQEKLGLQDCAAFDISAACAGFNYALSVADNFIRTGMRRSALVIGSEVMSRIIDWRDRGTCILFGDGAGAVLLEASDQPGIFSTHLHADGRYKDLLFAPNGLHVDEPIHMKMKGSEVFKVAVNKLGDIAEEVLRANKIQISTLDWFIPHQANLRIIQSVAKKINMPLERVVMTVGMHGNTSAASVPLALDQAINDGRIKRGQLLLLESFGGGFTWGASLVRY